MIIKGPFLLLDIFIYEGKRECEIGLKAIWLGYLIEVKGNK